MAAHRKAINRYCVKCGEWCYRVQRIRVFDEQDRKGWHLDESIYCTDCMPAKAAQRVAVVAATVGPLTRAVPIPMLTHHRPQHRQIRAA